MDQYGSALSAEVPADLEYNPWMSPRVYSKQEMLDIMLQSLSGKTNITGEDLTAADPNHWDQWGNFLRELSPETRQQFISNPKMGLESLLGYGDTSKIDEGFSPFLATDRYGGWQPSWGSAQKNTQYGAAQGGSAIGWDPDWGFIKSSGNVANKKVEDNGMGTLATLAAIAAAIPTGGASLATTLGSSMGLSGLAASAVGSGVIGGGLSALSGGNLRDVIESGLISGGLVYAGGTIYDQMGNAVAAGSDAQSIVQDLGTGLKLGTSVEGINPAINSLSSLGAGSLGTGIVPTAATGGLLSNAGIGLTIPSLAAGGSVANGFLSPSEMLDLLPDSAKTVLESEMGITDPVALSQAMQSPSVFEKLMPKVPGFLESAGGNFLAEQILGNQANKSVRSDMADVLDLVRSQNPFTGKGLEDLAVGALGSPLGRDTLQETLGSLQNLKNTNAGYGLATTGSNALSSLYSDPMSNPIMQAVSNLTAENAARRSAAGRGLNAGSMPAEMQQALLAGLGGQFSNLAQGYSTGIKEGTGFYNAEAKTLADLANASTQAMQADVNKAKVAGDLAASHMGTLNNMMPGYMNNYIATNSTAGGVGRLAQAGTQGNALSDLYNTAKAGKGIYDITTSFFD